ncbi:hypothetical protein BGX23_001961, partial [Mortierella sp. AD031]
MTRPARGEIIDIYRDQEAMQNNRSHAAVYQYEEEDQVVHQTANFVVYEDPE